MIPSFIIAAAIVFQAATTSEIRGRITDKETGLPIPDAVVSLTMAGGREHKVTATDSDGRYRFAELTHGEYAVFVGLADFRATHLRAGAKPYPIVLKPGEIREQVDVALPRARAMTVRVVDDLGEPLAGVQVTLESTDGRFRSGGFMRTTDDRGRLRLFGLAEGRYTICAETGSFAGGASSQRERFLPTCYPSAAPGRDAEVITLGRSDLDGIEIRMRRGKTYSVSGMVLDSAGLPPPPMSMISLTYSVRGGSSSMGGRLETDGRFTFASVIPGEYAIEVSIGGKERPEHRRPAESAFVPVQVNTGDVKDLVVQTGLAVEVFGRLVLEEPSASLPRRPGYGPILIWARLVGDRSSGMGSVRSGYADENREFYIDRLFGLRILELVNLPPGWYVKSIRYGSEDITDRPTQFKSNGDPSKLEILLSTKGANISGRVVNEAGEAAEGAHVVLLPADPARRIPYELTQARAAKGGAFRIGPVRRGDYSLVALPASMSVPRSDDLESLNALARKAERVSLAENEERSIDLRVVR
jgi:carboxypeptidase family protein